MDIRTETVDRAILVFPVEEDWNQALSTKLVATIERGAKEKLGIALDLSHYDKVDHKVPAEIKGLCAEKNIPLVLFGNAELAKTWSSNEELEIVPSSNEAVDFLFMEWLERDLMEEQ